MKKANLTPFDVLRTKEPIAKELRLAADTPRDVLIAAIVQNPSLLQRPIVEVGDKAVLARPAERVLDLLKEAGIV